MYVRDHARKWNVEVHQRSRQRDAESTAWEFHDGWRWECTFFGAMSHLFTNDNGSNESLVMPYVQLGFRDNSAMAFLIGGNAYQRLDGFNINNLKGAESMLSSKGESMSFDVCSTSESSLDESDPQSTAPCFIWSNGEWLLTSDDMDNLHLLNESTAEDEALYSMENALQKGCRLLACPVLPSIKIPTHRRRKKQKRIVLTYEVLAADSC